MRVPFGRSILGLASRRERLLIFTFHRVLERFDALLPSEPTIETFAELMRTLRASCSVLPLPEAVDRMRAGTLPRAAASITFDDGYRNNFSVALPILKDLGLTATFFVATGYLRGGMMWNDRIIESFRGCPPGNLDLRHVGMGWHEIDSDASRIRAIASALAAAKYLSPADRETAADAIVAAARVPMSQRLMMTADEILGLRDAGMTVGAHTVTHPILAKLPRSDAMHEISKSKSDLEEVLGAPVTLFAYPNGRPGTDYGPEHVDFVERAGFSAAVSTASGHATRRNDVFQLPRVAIWQTRAWRAQAHLLRSYVGR